MQIMMDQNSLQELANLVAPLIKQDSPQQDWAKLAEVRDDLFAGKSPAWIRLYVFDAFPEVQIENGQPQAWVKGVHGQGNVTRIYLPAARKWMHEHHSEIDWTAKMP
ncbi:hypothetical protein HCY78_08235 [Limosilactobacillus fermentum]|uniref:hypothetical protein n=1 Tax=Limosilactobacillus fermentum TaxID=1613 RepID=UPI0012483741|nr:hypothetical protein [Limosilactobacillus fermentum]QEY00533.1 hypothetical protein F4U91_02655 [Limosilactobacillus fermentum]